MLQDILVIPRIVGLDPKRARNELPTFRNTTRTAITHCFINGRAFETNGAQRKDETALKIEPIDLSMSIRKYTIMVLSVANSDLLRKENDWKSRLTCRDGLYGCFREGA